MDDAAFHFSQCRAFSRQKKIRCAERRTEGSLLLREWTFWLKPKTHTGEFKLNLLPKILQKILKKKTFVTDYLYTQKPLYKKLQKIKPWKKTPKTKKKHQEIKRLISTITQINRNNQNPKKWWKQNPQKLSSKNFVVATISKKNLKMLDNFSPLVDNQKNVKKLLESKPHNRDENKIPDFPFLTWRGVTKKMSKNY